MTNPYALLPDRVKAAVIDAIVIVAGMYAISEVLALFDQVPDSVRMIAAIFLFLLYDPLMTSQFGGTIGHTYSNITVKKERDTTQNISFFAALIRFVLKATLGWLSLLTVTANDKKMALHDLAIRSVVLEFEKKS